MYKPKEPILPWWAAGMLLGLVMTLAVALKKPLGVSTQFVVANGVVLKEVAPEYVDDHPMLQKSKYHTLGYGWWFDIGLLVAAAGTAILVGKWRPRATCDWASANGSVCKRLTLSFIGGFILLFGARLAGGCTSGQFASGWAQLSLSAVPFTIGMFVFGMIAARIFFPKFPKSPGIPGVDGGA
jgi:uncharacterized membrane protein YedE/YeeE